jgi:CRISPR-associated protein Csm5
MRYRVTCLTPTLVGDGQKLAPIDYMVWRDHVNVLDQRRIFKLLAKGPRLDGYLAQLKKADKLDFASWGGFAQNFAGRRIPFEHSSAIPIWERAHAEHLFIPTFAASTAGPYLPATAIKGALRTGAVFERWTDKTLADLAARLEGERPPRNPAVKIEDVPRARRVSAGDSHPVPYTSMKIHLLRVATLVARRDSTGAYDLGWKSVRGASDARHVEDSTPLFAEMALPGASFEGAWSERSPQDRARLFQASNHYAAGQLARHKQFAQWCGLARLGATVQALEERLQEISSRQDACLLSIGWGGGLHSKVAYLDTDSASFRSVIRQFPLYQKAIQTGLPFPKTRRIIFESNQPASLPGWVALEVV